MTAVKPGLMTVVPEAVKVSAPAANATRTFRSTQSLLREPRKCRATNLGDAQHGRVGPCSSIAVCKGLEGWFATAGQSVPNTTTPSWYASRFTGCTAYETAPHAGCTETPVLPADETC